MTDKILLNRIRTPDGPLLTSYHRHDYRTHMDKNGKEYMVDGGTDYLRRSAHGDEECRSVMLSSSHNENAKAAHWGTFGKHGDQPRHYVSVRDMTNEHLKAVLETQDRMAPHLMSIMHRELELIRGVVI